MIFIIYNVLVYKMVALVNAPNKIGKIKTFLTDCFLPKKPKLSRFFIYIVIY